MIKSTKIDKKADRPLGNHTLLTMPNRVAEPREFQWHIYPHSDAITGNERLRVGDIVSSECNRLRDFKIIDGSQGKIQKSIPQNSHSFCGAATAENIDILLVNRDSFNVPQYHSSNPLPIYTPLEKTNGSNTMRCAYSQIDGRYRWYKDRNMPVYKLCQYLIDFKSDYLTMVRITISNLKLHKSSSLAVYAGRSRDGLQLYYCGSQFANDSSVNHSNITNSDEKNVLKIKYYDDHCNGINSTLQFNSSCGAIYIIHIYNDASFQYETNYQFESKHLPSFDISYEWSKFETKLTKKDLCIDHDNWELDTEEDINIWWEIPVLWWIFISIAFTCLLIFGVIYFCFYHSRWPQSSIKTNNYHRDKTNSDIVQSPLSSPPAKHHLSYTPIRNRFKNHSLKKGNCCVCFGDDGKSLRLIECKHEICMECLKKYVNTALGDISMLPLKCPMHHQGCETVLGANLVQRVLSRSDFHRFQIFLDKAIYGDGMTCIFCHNYITFPPDMTNFSSDNDNVRCPHCTNRFCVRCQQQSHPGFKCRTASTVMNNDPNEMNSHDEQKLESWRKSHNVTKCPGCFKPIEKDDPDTCNHMVHKFTDSIPCVRDRTDYCYCCGIEVTRNHPHYELNTEINHFPDGVFNLCRTMKMKRRPRSAFRSPNSRRIVPTDIFPNEP